MPLKTLMEIPEKDPDKFKYVLDDYRENSKILLDKYSYKIKDENEEMYKLALLQLVEDENCKDEEIENECIKIQKHYKELISKIPTRFQGLPYFQTSNYLVEQIMKAASIVGYEIPIRPIIGTVSTQSINAGAFTLENGEPIIIVEEDILSFIL